MKHKKIVFVCTGNTCRSPMAEAALKAELKKRKIAWFTVQSAGLSAKAGTPMSPAAKEALAEAGIPFSEKFKSKQISEKSVGEAYAVICMTQSQKNLLGHFPNVTSFEELCGRDIPDPYGQGKEVYRATLNVLCACMPHIIKKIIQSEE